MNEASGELALAPYVPRLALEWDLDAAGARWRAQEATCCFVDISGFTALSERLARRGRIGAEELTEVLNHVFSRMLEVAYTKGGALLKFGGDALLLAFTGDDGAIMAAQGAVAMRAALREARTLPTSVGRVNLRMSVGVHTGTFHLFRVGGTHQELLISGPAATATTRMEQTADAGEIVISPETADRLPAGAVGAAKGDGRLLRWRHVVDGGPGPIPPRPTSSTAVAACVPVALRARLAQRGGESEHRLASVAFIKFQGVDDLLTSGGADRTAAALETVVRTIQDAADAESVTFLASDIDADGGKVILTTGVPATLEDDEGRLLRAARRIAEARHPLPVRIGVNRGHVFAGDIGTEYRRTFTVMGDTVNLAARLMAAAKPGEILATASVLDHARTHFTTDALEPFSVKGKSEPVQAFAVGRAVGSRSASFGSLPFQGRDKEVATLRDALRSATAGRGSTVLVDAERGVGKTRLVSEFARRVPPGQVLWLQGEPHGVGVPYQPLRAALRAVLGIDARDRPDAGHQLRVALGKLDGSLLPFAPLLAAAVEAEVPSTPESDAVAEEFVRSRIADLVVSTLDAACPTPLLVVAEDAHWFDDTTSDICGRLAAATASRPWLLCVTRRPDVTGGFAPLDPETRLPLALLTDDVARELVDVATGTAPLRPHERDVVVARAGGNPLFLEELLRIVRATDVESLPDTLDAVAMREIDALATTPRRVLRLASVLGRSFDRRLLGQLLDAESVASGPNPLAELRTQLVPDGDGGQVRFRHALLQEAAYQSLPFRQRLDLHRKVGEALEHDAEDPDAVAPALSLHFLSAQDWARTWRYARVAGRVAQQAHAHGEVVVHLDRAVTACRRLGIVNDEECAPVFSELG
jgi:class 3 adenylate cyclase